MKLVFIVIIGIFIIAISVLYIYFKLDVTVIAKLIKKNPSNSSIMFLRNGSTLLDLNSREKMPLASTVKYIIAIEYAKQAASGKIDFNEMIDVAILDQFYMPNTDGGSHNAWLDYSKNKMIEKHIRLEEVAKGMITFSSNANTEYLMWKLGLENINKTLDSLAFTSHEKLYPTGSAMFIKGNNEQFTLEDIRSLSTEEYYAKAYDIFNRFSAKNDTTFKSGLGATPLKFQKVWSDRLVASTTSDYISLMKKLNSKTYFTSEVHTYLDPVLEQLMENPANKEWLKHSGKKGGSTGYVFTLSFYATDLKGNTTEIALFFNDISYSEVQKLSRNANQFSLLCLTDKKFRENLVEELNH